jgi:hypothetical protein
MDPTAPPSHSIPFSSVLDQLVHLPELLARILDFSILETIRVAWTDNLALKA